VISPLILGMRCVQNNFKISLVNGKRIVSINCETIFAVECLGLAACSGVPRLKSVPGDRLS
jgi:hypothetical protein